MVTLRPFQIFDTLDFNNINLDILTETFHTKFYGKYICHWPEYCITLLNSTQKISAYLLGKVEGDKNKTNWHGHVSAVTVCPSSRRQGYAKQLMDYLEKVSEDEHNAYYVDLFVRPSNTIAVNMYRKLGYEVYQTVFKYYSSLEDKGEDAYGTFFIADMRKSMKRDSSGVLSKPTHKVIQPNELEFN